MRKVLMGAILFSLIFLLAACGGGTSETSSSQSGGENSGSSEEPITLSYAFFTSETTYPGVVATKWAEEIEKRTDGKVKVELYFGGTLLDAANMFDGVANNTADVGMTALSYEPGRFPLMEIAEIARGYSTAEGASQVMDALLEEYPPDFFEKYEIVKVISTHAMNIHSVEPISSLGTLKGQQIRIGGALTPVLEKLGGAPVGMSQAEQAQALQTGVIDGYVSDLGGLKDMKFAEIITHVTDYPLAISTLVGVMNKEKFDSLPEDIQQVIKDLKNDMPVIAGQYLDQHTEEVLKWSKEEHGLEIVSLENGEKEKWDKALIELENEYVEKAKEKGLPAEEFTARVYELIEEHSNK